MDNTEDELARIFADQRPALTRYLASRTRSVADSEDLVQEVWIRFARNGLAALAAPVPYLMRIARNISIDHHRSGHRRLRHAEVDALLEVQDNAPGPEDAAIARDTLRRLESLMDDLPERRRLILMAARIEGEPHKVIAERHGVSTRTVEMEIRAALEYCATHLQEKNHP